MSFHVRPVERHDVPAVAALLRSVLAEFGLTFGEGSATDAQVLDLPDAYEALGGAFWVATEGDSLLGTCGVFPLGDGTFELRKMYLAQDARGRGVGRSLLDQACAFAKAAGGRRLVLDTTEQMTAAIRFYESHGFIRDDSEVRGARCSRGYVRAL